MSIVYSNKRKLYIKISSLEILKKALFSERTIKYLMQPNIEGHYEITLFNEKDFKELKMHYENEVIHIDFVRRYKAGEFESTFEWLRKISQEDI